MTRNYPRESYVDNFLNRALKEIGTVVFELLRNEFSHLPLRQNLWKTIMIGNLITLRELVAQERSNQMKERMYSKNIIYMYI